jgi:hypothetical protein
MAGAAGIQQQLTGALLGADGCLAGVALGLPCPLHPLLHKGSVMAHQASDGTNCRSAALGNRS